MHRKRVQISRLSSNNVHGNDGPVEPEPPNRPWRGSKSKKPNASGSCKSQPLDGCNGNSFNNSASGSRNSSARSASVPGKNVSRSENNVGFGTRRSNTSERLDSFVEPSGLLGPLSFR